jgi:flagellin-specific chaperone FliS
MCWRLEADGCRLVVLLYENALQRIQQARQHLNNGEIRPRSEAIT